ncbi:MAG: hypothetical protein ACRBBN_12665 [Methyloligellaceae bacterium]
MHVCPQCGKNISATDHIQTSPQTVTVATDWQLRRISHVQRLALATINVKQEKDLSRREIPNWIANVIYDYEGRILWPVGRLFEIHDETIDLAFGDDGSFRWLSDFLSFASEPPKQKPQKRVLTRLRLIDLAFRIKYPKRAELIAK